MKKSLPSKRSIYKKWGITAPTLDLWIAQGVDIFSDADMARKVAEKQPSKPTETGTAHQQAKLRKLTAEASLAEIKAAQAEGKLIALDDVCIILTKIGHSLKAQLGKLRAELPPVVYGLSQAEMSRTIAAHVDRTLQAICDELDKVKTEPPRPQ